MQLSALFWWAGLIINTSVFAETSNSTLDGNAFHMTLHLPGSKLNRRGLVYINDQGYITTHQSEATVFFISNGQLRSDGNIVSADPSDDYIPFAPDSDVQSISTTWTHDPSLTWTNPSFAGNGVATYCQGSNSRVYLVLHSPPAECKPAVASPIPLPSTTATSTSTSSISTSSAPTPTVEGLAYYGYRNPSQDTNPSDYNPNTNIDIYGFVQDINFHFTGDEQYQFPGQFAPIVADQ